MSVFGGDSWAREAQHRKRRVDDLMVLFHDTKDSSSPPSYKKLSNGKYACLVCPNNPILDSPLMLSMHIKGSRHMAAEYRLKERELWKQEEIKKRISLSGDSAGSTSSSPSSQQFQLSSKPLIERTRKAAFEALHNQMPEPNAENGCHNVKFRGNASYFNLNYQSASERGTEPSPSVTPGPGHLDERNSKCEMRADGEMLVEQHACRERELKFTSAGWKRDCHGKWFRDENVEFDSDEEDPNVSLS